MIKMDVTGIEREVRRLYDIQKELDKGKVQQVLREQGQRIVDSARAIAPHKTGALRKAIGFIKKNDKKFPNVVLIGIQHDWKAYEAGKSYPGKYGNILQTDGIQTARRANKFMNMALQINANAVQEGVVRGLEEIIDNVR
jgi:hypothetical protein